MISGGQVRRDGPADRLRRARIPHQRPATYGSVQCWLAVLRQVATTSWVPARLEEPGSVRHSVPPWDPRTYSWRELWVHAWLAAPVHLARTTLPPFPALPLSVMHAPPCTSLPWLNAHCSAAALLQAAVTTLVPVTLAHRFAKPLITCDAASVTVTAPEPVSSPAAPKTHSSGRAKGCGMTRVTGDVAVNVPFCCFVLLPTLHVVIQATITLWCGLEFTVTVTVPGLLTAAATAQLALVPLALHDLSVLALAAVPLAATAPAASNPVSRQADIRENFSIMWPLRYRPPGERRRADAAGLPLDCHEMVAAGGP